VRLKLDENLGTRGRDLFLQAGHDVVTVPGQDLCSATDRALIDICRSEGRCLVTLDLDFSNPLRFKPSDYAGVAVLRLPTKPTPDALFDLVRTLIGGFARQNIEGQLWIVQRGRVRVYQQDERTES
jgi:Domain of unknown function (DUF5615)